MLVLLLFSLAPAVASTFRVSVQVAEDLEDGTIPARLTLRPQEAGEHGASAVVEVRAEAPGEVAVDLASGQIWILRVEAAGYWAPPQPVLPDRQRAGSTVRLLPTGTLRGELVLPPDGEAPARMTVRVEPAPGGATTAGAGGRAGEPPGGSFPCPVEGSSWSCEVPAGELDLRLRASEEFAPVYLWGVSLPPHQEADVGPVTLRPGSSVVGWVETAAEGRPVEGATVRLTPETAGMPTAVETLERLRAVSLETSTNARGFFQLRGVAPGIYRVTATQEGHAPAQVHPVEVHEGLESEIAEPLALGRPGTLTLSLDPALDPYGRRWEVQLFSLARTVDGAVGSRQGEASEAGSWTQADLPPGRYRLSIADQEGGRWVSEEIRVLPGVQEQFVSVPVLEVHGTVSLGEEPVSGVLWLGGKDGERRCRFAVDLDGEFEGYLPDEGVWPAEILLDEGELRLVLEPLEVRRRKGKGHAEVEIRIPDTHLEGEVVDRDGRAVAGAQVLVHTSGEGRQPSRQTTKADGAFRFRGLPEGHAMVVAQRGQEMSDWVPVALQEDLAPPSLRLTLQSRRTVSGRISGASGPVPGARLVVWPQLTSPGGGRIAQSLSGPDGSFEVELSADAVAATVLVRAPTYATRLLSLPLSTEAVEPVEIVLEHHGGTLVIDLGATGDRDLPTSTPFLVHNGAVAPLPILTRLLGSDGASVGEDGRLHLSNLELGSYSLCSGKPAIAAMMQGKEPPDAVCEAGFLAPMGELVLHLPG